MELVTRKARDEGTATIVTTVRENLSSVIERVVAYFTPE